jgi:hypothetical protein
MSDHRLDAVIDMLRLQPLSIRPLQSSQRVDLRRYAGFDIQKVLKIFHEFSLDVLGQDLYCALAEEMCFTEEQTVAFLGDDAIVVEVRAGKCAVDVSVQRS